MIYLQAVDLEKRRALLSSGAVLQIHRMVDEDCIETDDPEQAVAFTVLGGDLTIHFRALALPWPVMN